MTTHPHNDDLPPDDPDETPPDADNSADLTDDELDRLDTINYARAHDTNFNEARLHHELDHLGAIPDNIKNLPRDQQIRHAVSAHRAQRAHDIGLLDLDAFIHEPEPEYDWLIPGLLERGDRVIITGEEGRGKSTLLRQIGIQIAAGIHPFTLDPITPKRVLLLDVENPRRLVRRALRPLRLSAGPHLLPGYFIPVIWPQGLDLRAKEDQHQLAHLLETIGVDLLLAGPTYKLASGDPTTEEHAKTVSAVLDELRTRHDFALILEAHQPYPTSGSKRAERPYGASLWSRWPDFGLHLARDGELRHWRGDRDERDWPQALTRGGTWPWTPITDPRGVTFARILETTRGAGKKLSLRELAETLGTGSPNTMKRAIEANQKQFDDLIAELEGDS